MLASVEVDVRIGVDSVVVLHGRQVVVLEVEVGQVRGIAVDVAEQLEGVIELLESLLWSIYVGWQVKVRGDAGVIDGDTYLWGSHGAS